MVGSRLLELAWGAIGRLRDALTDPARRERAILLVLAVYTVLWTLYGVLAKGSQDVHPDMAELVAWAREPALGYLKHPPVAAWLVWLWFAIVPVADWSFYLLGALTASVALWIIWRLCADYLDADKRVVGIALLTLIPFFGFHALKYNVNTLLIPLWAATTLAFLRSFERRSALWAILAGFFAAASMATKYWSIFLIAGLVVVALADRRCLAYFRSPAPWVTIVIGALVLAPHVVWLISNDFAPFVYAAAVHGAKSFATTLHSVTGYVAGSLGYVAVPVVLALAAARPDRATLHDMVWPRSDDRRLAVLAFWAPLLLPVVGALATGTDITSLWSMSAWSLLPVVLLASPRVSIAPQRVLHVLAIAVAFPILMLAVAPLIAVNLHRGGMNIEQTQGSVLAPMVERLWREMTDKPLRIVGGDFAYQLAFYLHDRPSAFPDFQMAGLPWITEARIMREGMAMVCRAGNAACLHNADVWMTKRAGGRRLGVTAERRHAGLAGVSERYVLLLLPPER